MRKFSLLLLLATTAAPALAAPDNDRAERRAERRAAAAEKSESRAQRAETRRSEAREQRVIQRERPQADREATSEAIRERVVQRRQVESTRSDDNDSPAERRRAVRRDDGAQTDSTLQRRDRRVRTIPDTQPSVTTERRREIARGFEGRSRRDYRDGNYRRWSRDWHRDNRYDWRRWRDRNRSTFRLGFYYDPFGSSYRRWSIGSFLFPSYYGSRYHLSDPWRYRLPPAYGPYQWVRYWNDALLVNIYTGEVVDVMHSFFW